MTESTKNVKPKYYDPETGDPSDGAMMAAMLGSTGHVRGELARLERERDEAVFETLALKVDLRLLELEQKRIQSDLERERDEARRVARVLVTARKDLPSAEELVRMVAIVESWGEG